MASPPLPQVQHLLVVISEMAPEDKRLFLRFISGSPRLPVGGFAGLSPRLTIVKAVATLGTMCASPFPHRCVPSPPSSDMACTFVTLKLGEHACTSQALAPFAHPDAVLSSCVCACVFFRGLLASSFCATTGPLTGSHQDELLPTCSTCQVYLKLPAYSSLDILRDKLMTAIREGQEYFALD